MPSVETQKLVEQSEKSKRETSKDVQNRVQQARDMQIARFKDTKLKANAEMSTRNVKEYCELSDDSRKMMLSATSTMNLSTRSYFKVIKVARTIADLEGCEKIAINHLAEALQYRPKESNL